jgi:hypothetical protein
LSAWGRIFPFGVRFPDIESNGKYDKVHHHLAAVTVEVPETIILFVAFSLPEHRLRFYRTLAAVHQAFTES